jgi:APA family basic amino acid/polyamine antiporter
MSTSFLGRKRASLGEARVGAAGKGGLLIRKPSETLVAEAQDRAGLRRAVGALDLTALGIGGIIGTGIFVIIGEAIGDSGPAIVVSFVLAAVTCVFSALSYAELASTIPISGSAYSYSYATLGELVAWVIGWDLLIEYGFSVATVSVGWGGYVKDLLDSVFGVSLPTSIAGPPGEGGVVNLPAVMLVVGVTALLLAGVRRSARTNTAMVVFKLVVLGFFIVAGLTAFTSDHFEPFAPSGFGGISDAAALIFFAYIGFDAVSTAGSEARRPRRDLPIAVVGSLLIATFVYLLVAVTAVGLAPSDELAGSQAPLTDALRSGAGLGSWAGDLLSLGALVAISSVVLTFFYGQTRIFYAMSRDGLVPTWFTKLTPRRIPARITIPVGILTALGAAVIPLSDLAELINIGTLFAFVLVNAGVIYLRRAEPDLERGFRSPLVPIFPLVGIGLCIYLMTKLQEATWWRFGIWMAIGLVVYFAYSRGHSRLRRGEDPVLDQRPRFTRDPSGAPAPTRPS